MSFEHVNSWTKILHFRTHHLSNSTPQLTLNIEPLVCLLACACKCLMIYFRAHKGFMTSSLKGNFCIILYCIHILSWSRVHTKRYINELKHTFTKIPLLFELFAHFHLNFHDGFCLLDLSMSQVIDHLTCYEFNWSHW